MISLIPILIILLAIIGNLSSFFIFRFNQELKKITSMVYLSFIVIIDIFTLFTWNLDIFLRPYYGINIEDINLFTCRFFTFLQFFSQQSSAFLMSLVSIDRYKSTSLISTSSGTRQSFGTIKSAIKWSFLICLSIAIINSHFLFLNGFYNSPTLRNQTITSFINGTEVNVTLESAFMEPGVNCYYYVSRNFKITNDLWNYVNLFFYCLIPGGFTVIFNILLITKTTKYKNCTKMNSSLIKSLKRKQKTTFTLLAISFASILMSFPATVYYMLIYHRISKEFIYANEIGAVLNFISFFNNASVFFNCFITNFKFRKIVLNFILRCNCQGQNKSRISSQSINTKLNLSYLT